MLPLNLSQVWFLEEEKLPVVSNSVEEEKKHKILMKSPWEILQLPVGSGGVFSLLSSNNVPENLSEMGVEYIEVSEIRYSSLHSFGFLRAHIRKREKNILRTHI